MLQLQLQPSGPCQHPSHATPRPATPHHATPRYPTWRRPHVSRFIYHSLHKLHAPPSQSSKRRVPLIALQGPLPRPAPPRRTPPRPAPPRSCLTRCGLPYTRLPAWHCLCSICLRRCGGRCGNLSLSLPAVPCRAGLPSAPFHPRVHLEKGMLGSTQFFSNQFNFWVM